MSNWSQEQLDARNCEVFGDARNAFIGGIQEKTFTEVTPDLRPEWMIEAECTKLLEEDSWRALRTDPVSNRAKGKGFGEVGMADHLYMRYADYADRSATWASQSQVMWIEFKSAKGKPSKAQLDWHAKERARGALTLIAGVDFPASVEGFKSWYATSGLQRHR